VLLLSGCGKSEPSSEDIKNYIENYQIVHGLKVASMTYNTKVEQESQPGTIQVSGKFELVEPLYVEDEGSRIFRKNVAEALLRNGFSEREINHDIYSRVVQATTRVPDENEYYTFLKIEHEPGFEINFSANLSYRSDGDGYLIEGPVKHPKLLGAGVEKFSNPALDSLDLVQKAVENVLSEQARYRGLMKQSRALLTQVWDNDFGMVIWNRKTPYLGNENLSIDEKIQLNEFRLWRGVYHISNIKPVQYRTPHSSNFFELGSYTTEGIATCLRQTGFTQELTFLKSKFEQYCEFGKQYPVRIKLSSVLDKTNVFVAKALFEVNGVSSQELIHDSVQFSRERNELARFSDQQRLSILKQSFNINHHNRSVFTTIASSSSKLEQIDLRYTGPSDYVSAGLFDESEVGVTVNADGQLLASELINGEIADNTASLELRSSEGTGDQIGTSASLEDDAKAKAETELVKAIQQELKRLGVYESRIDGIAGSYTYWGMAHVQKQLGKNNLSKVSIEFLTVLRDTPENSIELPTEPYRPPNQNESEDSVKVEEILVESREQRKNNRTLAGNALRWFGKQFNKKKEQPAEDGE
jgi:hypothetical protein